MRKIDRFLVGGGIVLNAALALAQRDDASAAVGCGLCGSFFVFIILALIAINVAILVWVARDAKDRGMDNAILWMLLVLLTGLVGLIVYLLVRPQGNLVVCPNCSNKRLQVAVHCPHCGAAA
jgi:ABC-type tungstate transport system substrate-binding protein